MGNTFIFCVHFYFRYWYENLGQFSKDQLQQIRRTTLALIMCDNSDGLSEIQPKVMERESGININTPCRDLPQMNLSPWKESRLWRVPAANQVMTVKHYISDTYGTSDG